MLTMPINGAETGFDLSKLGDAGQKTVIEARKTLTALHNLLMDMRSGMTTVPSGVVDAA